MADTDNAPETVTPGDSQTTVQTTAPAPGNAVDPAEVERLRKEREQIEMERNRLRNQLAEREKAEEEARQKQLAANEEWKQLAEQNQAKLEALEKEREEAQRTAELKEATSSVFAQFPADVVEVANEAGLSASDNTEEAKEALKSKLEKIAAKVSTTTTTAPNNPSTQPVTASTRAELLERAKYGDKEARMQAISNIPAVEAMRKMAGAS